MDNQSNQYPSANQNTPTGNSMPAFSGAFDDDSSRPAINTVGQPVAQQQYTPPMYGQPVPQQQYAPPMYGQPVPQQQYAPPMYGQPVPQQQYAPPMYGQPVPQQQYVPPMYGQPVPQQQYAPPMYGQPVAQQQYVPPMYGQPVAIQYGQPVPIYQPPALPKEVMDRKLFRKHCSRVGLMLMADMGLMTAVEIVVIFVAAIVLAIISPGIFKSNDTGVIMTTMLPVVLLAGGLSAIVGNMLPSALHLRKWRYKFADPFRGDKLSPLFILTALITALGLNSAWCTLYYFCKGWFEEFIQFTPNESNTLYSQDSMPLFGMICYLIWVCVIAPVTEEYMFRGAMLKTLSKYGSGFAIVASALAFGLMHGNMGQTPMAFLIGLVMGYVAAKSGNIRQTIFIHMVNNILASLPQIFHYFLPDWYDYYAEYVEYFDYFTMAFAAVALIVFIVRRTRGLNARKARIASGSEEVSNAERRWIRLEVPDERRLPQFDSVKHKFAHFVTSGGMIFFIVVCLLSIFVSSFLPYLVPNSYTDFNIFN